MQEKLFNQLNSLSGKYSPIELKKAYKSISETYRSHTPYIITQELEALAYAFARMPATTQVLNEILSPLDGVSSLLDLGCGPGSILWAREDWSLDQVTLVDQSKPLIDLGRKLAYPSVEWINKDIFKFVPEMRYELVSASYLLNELDESHQNKLLEMIWQASKQYIVLVEPGTPKGFMNIQRSRDYLIQKGAYAYAPCTHENTCPMSEEDWCHFKVRLQRSSIHKAIKGTLGYEDEKYSYFIATKDKTREGDTSRIVKNPIRSKGLIQIDLCNKNGLERIKIPKSHSSKYKTSKSYLWGDKIS